VIGEASAKRSFLTRRWIAAHISVALFVAGCIGLGLWQVDRLHQKRARNRLVAERSKLPVRSLAELRTRPSVAAYRRVSETGRFDAKRQIVLRSRALDGRPGEHLLTPLVTSAGDAVIVDRGWVPFGARTTAATPLPGVVRVRGTLLPPERPFRFGPRESKTGTITASFYVDIGRFQQQMPYRLYPLYLLMRSQRPAQPSQLPVAVGLPPLDEGPHLSYAIQWFSFATLALGAYGVLIRRSLRGVR
jgi:surfeit locus 1 family protein